MIRVAPYSQLASAYDRALGIVSFLRTRRAFEQVVARYGLGFRSAADIGCGTGLFARYLRGCWGVPVFAVDSSPAMLRIAAGRGAATGICFLQQDARCLNLPRPVDLITANFDTINHLITPRDLAQAFRRIGANLRPGGHFVFDVIPRYRGLQRRFVHLRRLRARGRALYQHIRWDPRRGLLAIRIVHCWPRPRPATVELHVERAYPPALVAQLLFNAGFVIRGVHDACSMRVAQARPSRLIIVARKIRREECDGVHR
jgi:SAM-dependent methyltransferase